MSNGYERLGFVFFAVAIFGAVAALGQGSPPEKKICKGKCGDPPQVIGQTSCELNQSCCEYINCVTLQYAGACCNSLEFCRTGIDSETGLPYAYCEVTP